MKYLFTLFLLLPINMDAFAKDQTQIFGYYTNRLVSTDMIPTLLAGEFIFSDPEHYNNNPIERGDIVLFNSPKKDGVVWVKRVIGLPGEIVTVRNGKTYINSNLYIESYVNSENNKKVSLNMNISTSLKEKEYFLMGDNRDNSYDSRFLGPVLRRDILAKTKGIYFSKNVSRIGKVK